MQLDGHASFTFRKYSQSIKGQWEISGTQTGKVTIRIYLTGNPCHMF